MSGARRDRSERPGRSERPRREQANAERDLAPSRTGTAIALTAASVAVVATVAGGGFAALVGALGVAVMLAGLRVGSGPTVTGGALVLFAGVLVAGVLGAPAEAMLLATAATVVAWDVADNAVGLGEQLGRAADTARAEFVHAAASATVASLGAAVAYVAFEGVSGGQTSAALVLLLLGGIALAAALK